MRPTFRTFVTLWKAKIDYMDEILFLANTDKKILRLDISVDEIPLVHHLYPLYHLWSQKGDRFASKLLVTEIKKVLYTWAHNIHHHNVEVTFYSEILHRRKASESL
jgi:hypothetical protein